MQKKSQKTLTLLCSLFLVGCSGTHPELGVKSGQFKPCPSSPNCVNSQATESKHAIEPLHFKGSVKEAEQKLLEILKTEEQAGLITVEDGYIRATFTSNLFRFVDDVEFYIPPGQKKEETMIHVRSASRVGYSDLGVNRKRIEGIRSKLKSS